MNIINEFFVSFILIKLYFKFKVCRKIKFPLLWKFYFSKWKFYFSADKILAKNPSQNISFNVPMIDFSTSNRGGKFQGEFTNIGQSYIVSASHMSTSLNTGK